MGACRQRQGDGAGHDESHKSANRNVFDSSGSSCEDMSLTGRGGRVAEGTGLLNRRTGNVSVNSDTAYENTTKNLADYLALLREKSPDLALLVERWDELPEPVRVGIVAMLEAVKGDRAAQK
jgi:hypothetical protein